MLKNIVIVDFNEKLIRNNPKDFTINSTKLINLISEIMDLSKSIILSVLFNDDKIPELENNLKFSRLFMSEYRKLEKRAKNELHKG